MLFWDIRAITNIEVKMFWYIDLSNIKYQFYKLFDFIQNITGISVPLCW